MAIVTNENMVDSPVGQPPHIPDYPRAKQDVVICSLILIFNLIATAVILAFPALRQEPKYRILVSASVAQILSTLLSLPADAKRALHGCDQACSTSELFHISNVFADLSAPTTIALSIAAIAILLLVPKSHQDYVKRKNLASFCGVVVPWLFGISAFLPCSVSLCREDRNQQVPVNVLPFQNYNSTRGVPSCLPIIDSYTVTLDTECGENLTALILSTVLWGFSPLALSVVLALCATILHFAPRQSADYNIPGNHHPASTPEEHLELVVHKRSVWDVLFASLLVACFNIPRLVDLLSTVPCDREMTSRSICRLSHFSASSDRSLELLRWSTYFSLPIVWILDEKLKHACATACGKLCIKSCVIL